MMVANLSRLRSILGQSQLVRHLYATVRTLRWQSLKQDLDAVWWVASRDAAIDRYLGEFPVRKLHLGAGSQPKDGWLNCDIARTSLDSIFLDVTKPFPLETSTFDYAFSEHIIEHVSYAGGLHMLRECHRVLKPGGRLRVATPDLRKLIQMYIQQDESIERALMADYHALFPGKLPGAEAIHIFNNEFRDWGHQFIYDAPTLARSLEAAGFDAGSIKQWDVGQSDDANLATVEARAHSEQLKQINAYGTMVFEAAK
jgi:predicted SAM-dependent methyltransferase